MKHADVERLEKIMGQLEGLHEDLEMAPHGHKAAEDGERDDDGSDDREHLPSRPRVSEGLPPEKLADLG